MTFVRIGERQKGARIAMESIDRWEQVAFDGIVRSRIRLVERGLGAWGWGGPESMIFVRKQAYLWAELRILQPEKCCRFSSSHITPYPPQLAIKFDRILTGVCKVAALMKPTDFRTFGNPWISHRQRRVC